MTSQAELESDLGVGGAWCLDLGVQSLGAPTLPDSPGRGRAAECSRQ